MNVAAKITITIGAVCLAGGGWFLLSRDAPVTDTEARTFVDTLVSVAQSGDIEGLCDYAVLEGSCEILVESHADRVPTEAPRVVCTWPLSGSSHRVVALTGTDNTGENYVNYLAVVRDKSRLIGSPTVYWVNHVVEDLDLGFEQDAIVCR